MKRYLAVSYVLVALLVMPPVALGQVAAEPDREWAAVRALQPGNKLIVKLKDGKTIEGKLSSASDTLLTLSNDNKSIDLNRESILRVYRLVGSSATKSTLIGAASGAGAGAILALGAGEDETREFDLVNDTVAGAIVTVIGVGVGAVAGFIVGKFRRKRVLIYAV